MAWKSLLNKNRGSFWSETEARSRGNRGCTSPAPQGVTWQPQGHPTHITAADFGTPSPSKLPSPRGIGPRCAVLTLSPVSPRIPVGPGRPGSPLAPLGPWWEKQENQAAAHSARNPAPFSILQVSRNAQKGDFWVISLPFPPEPGDHLCWLVQLLPLLPGPQPRSGTC